MKIACVAILTSCMMSCQTAPQHQQKRRSNVAPDSVVNRPPIKTNEVEQRASLEFVNYNDDGDYSLFIAERGDSSYSFINYEEDRSLNRGDLIDVRWKDGTIFIAGDGETPQKADILVSVKKVGDGAVSKFRHSYGKKIKYTFSSEATYSKYYLDKLYLFVDYYLANTKVPLLQYHINKKDDITYSIEQQTKNDREYTMLGISTTSEHQVNTIQWLYYDNEGDKLYEYDLPDDKLVPLR
jgi:hypothetical protein